jgi:acyl transferase domain-containing protein/NAD(P)-dependent dehydrogenase (short-subunit alcohol dehydrogenase family)
MSANSSSTRGTSGQHPDSTPASPEPIAIIGIGCRFPGGANGPEAFWKMICEGVDAIREVPSDRWDADSYYDARPSRPGKMVTRWGGFVDQKLGTFDAMFFGMSPREASHLDPMQAWLMEVTWEAFEDAGIRPEGLAGSRTGVFVGVFTEDAKISYLRGSNRDLIGSHTGTGTSMTMAANRLSYWYDLRGPSLALDTACSSSMVCVHLACQSLWNGESTLALAGGVNAMFQPEFTIAESRAGMLSPDGRCKTFDSRANGYVRGEGAGMVVLKKLSDALKDGDAIYAVIRATASNQDGRTPGITVPSGEAQKKLAREALDMAGIDPKQVRYIEAHGTGTPVGDPIEAKALGEVFGAIRPEGETCLVGSVKTNIGHLEAAAGVAGLIKAALVLKNKQVPPHLHLLQPNPNIDFGKLKLRVAKTVETLPEGEGPAFAAVNSFGFGGTNAHAVLQEAPAVAARPPTKVAPRPALMPLSARSPESLRRLAVSYRELAERNESQPEGAPSLSELSGAAAHRRSHHPHRLAVVARSYRELAESLGAFVDNVERPGVVAGQASSRTKVDVAFVYTGMGPQWWAMGRALLESEPVFREAMERVDAILRPWTGWSLVAELSAEESRSRMGETQISQPANFGIQVALTELLRSWGLNPSAIVGHSAGEAAAFWAAGAYTLEQACLVIYTRSRLQHRTSGQGKLYAVGLPYDQALAAIDGHKGVSIAAINSPSAVTLAGDPDVLERITAPLLEKGVFCKALKVDVPFHSHYMEPLRDELLESLLPLEPSAVTLPLYSTVTGQRAEGPELDGSYWWLNVRDPVYFAAATYKMLEDGYRVFLEIGPHPVLSNSIQECSQQRNVTVRALPTLRRGGDDHQNLLGAVGALYTAGVEPSWAELAPEPSRPVKLPTYPWDRQHNWDESAEARADRLDRSTHPLLGRRQVTPQPVWHGQVDRNSPAYLVDHAIQGAVVFPGAGYIELGLQALRQATGRATGPVELCDIRFHSALFLREEPTDLRTEVQPDGLRFTVFSRTGVTEAAWHRHASGAMRSAAPRKAANGRLQALQAAFVSAEVLEAEECYTRLCAMQFEYGPAFQGLRRLALRDGEALARIELGAEHVKGLAGYEITPPLLDACFQVLIAGTQTKGDSKDVFMPVGIERLAVHGALVGTLWAHGRMRTVDRRNMVGDLEIYSEDGRLLVSLEGLRVKSLAEGDGKGLRSLFQSLKWAQVQPGTRKEKRAVRGSWVLLSDGTGTARALAERIEAGGGSVVHVRPGAAFSASADGRQFEVNPGSVEDFGRLLGALAQGERPGQLVHLWGLDAPEASALTAKGLMEAQAAGSVALLHLGQALEKAAWPQPPQLWIVTRGARAVTGDSHPLAVAQSPIWGFGASLFQQEHPELAGGLVDLEPGAPAGEAAALLALMTEPPADTQVALRQGNLWSDRLELAPQLADGSLPARMRPDGTYLITGGRGGLGLLFARWLIERGARRLVLAGRTPLPERREWHTVAADSSVGRQIAAIRELEALGASIHAVALDVSDEAQVRAFHESFRREGWPAFRGVIHAAGVVQPTRFSDQTASRLLATMEAKLAGGWSLHTVLAEEPLDFFVMCSSANALGFSTGVVDYAAANAFLDGLAHLRRHQGHHALAVNWGAWGEVGMASIEQVARDFELRGITPIPPDQGLAALERSLEHDLSQVVVLAADWQRLLGTNFAGASAPPMLQPIIDALAAEAAAGGGQGSQGREDVRSKLLQLEDEAERRALVEDFLRRTVARSLKLAPEQVDPNIPLQGFGLDSIIAVELRHHINGGLGVSPTLMELLQGASVASLTDALMPKLPKPEPEATPEAAELDALAAQLGELGADQVDALLQEADGAEGALKSA